MKALLYTLSTMLLAWILPWLFNFFTAKPTITPFSLYSCEKNTFAYIDNDENKKTEYKDMKGNTYTEEQYDSILPFFYYRQLAAKDRLPDSIKGIPVTALSIRRSNFIIRLNPRDVNVNAPKVYMLMESMPDHVDLEQPVDAFRLNDQQMTVIHMDNNSIDKKKTDMFTDVLNKKGFAFPIHDINGNPTTRKEYDEGYIIIDNNRQVFHVKQISGRPYVRNAGIDTSLKMKHAFITEFSSKKMLAFLTDESNNLYVLTPTYELHKLPIMFNPEKETMQCIGDMLNWTVRISDNNGYSLYALDARTYEMVDKFSKKYEKTTIDNIASMIFPFTLSFTDSDDKWVKPRIENFSVKAIGINILLVMMFILLYHKKRKDNAPYAATIALFGIFALIPSILIKK